MSRARTSPAGHRRHGADGLDEPDLWDRRVEGDGKVVMGANTTRFHRDDCSMAAGRDWPVVTRAEAIAQDRRPCGMCRP